MRWPRFTTLQLLLVAAHCALIFGLATASWRSNPWGIYPRTITQSRLLEALIITTGFVGWSIAWGLVARRQQPIAAEFKPPVELTLIWGLMFVGGLVAVATPVAVLVVVGPQPWPGVYYALYLGVVLTASAASRRSRHLSQVIFLQLLSLLACDPVNFLLGLIAQRLLRRLHVQSYLNHVNQPVTAAATAPLPETCPPGSDRPSSAPS